MPFYYAATLLFSLFVFFHPFETYAGEYFESFKLNVKINKTDKKDPDDSELEHTTIICKIESNSYKKEDFNIKLIKGSIVKSCDCREEKSTQYNLNKLVGTPYECECSPKTAYDVEYYNWLRFKTRKNTCKYFMNKLFNVYERPSPAR
jgi:hypothetical protein